MNLNSDESNFKDKLLSIQMSTARKSDRNTATLAVDPDVPLSSAFSSSQRNKLKSSKKLNIILSLVCLVLVCCLVFAILTNLRCLNTLTCLKSSSNNVSAIRMATTETLSSMLSNQLINNNTQIKHDDHLTELSFNSKWNSSRLPPNLTPYHYVISLKIDVYNKKFMGNCTIYFKCEEKTSLLVVHSDSNLIFESLVYLPVIHETDPANSNVTTRRLNVKSMETNLFFNYIIIELNSDEMFKKTHQYSVTFENFSSEITNNLKGLYMSNYNTNNGTVK
jgi:hypothetical protein